MKILRDLVYALVLYAGCLGIWGGAFIKTRGFAAPGIETATVVVDPIPLCTDGSYNDSIYLDPDSARDLATEWPWHYEQLCDSAVARLITLARFDTAIVWPMGDTVFKTDSVTHECVADTMVYDTLTGMTYGDSLRAAHPTHVHPTACNTQYVTAVFAKQDTIPLSLRFVWASQAGAARVTTAGGDTLLVEPYESIYYRLHIWSADQSFEYDELISDTVVAVNNGNPEVIYSAQAQACGVIGVDSTCTAWGDSVGAPFPYPMIVNPGLVPPVVVPDTSTYEVDG